MNTIEKIRKALTEPVADYAVTLHEAGFTIYLPVKSRYVNGEEWFHYSRDVDGKTCVGVFSMSDLHFGHPNHSMPLKPSVLNGSGAHVGAIIHDDNPRGTVDPLSVEAAEIVASPTNWCPWNAEPTMEAIEAARNAHLSNRGLAQKWYRGATLPNAGLASIGSAYVPASEWEVTR